jgi:SP family arabinose:H+ symporter-like MFS transporter
VSLGLTAWAFFTQHYLIVPACIFAFIASHAIGQGTVIWVYISEIFPNCHRAEGQALGSFTHWVFAALLTTFFPQMVTSFAPGYVFLFFAGMMVLQLVWVRLMVTETKGRSTRGDSAGPRRRVNRPRGQPGLAGPDRADKPRRQVLPRDGRRL